MSLSLDAALDRHSITPGEPGVRHYMLTIRSSGGDAPRLPLNLALAIDTSGSMHGSKLARAKDAAGLVVRHLTAIDRVAIVTYDDDARVIAPSTPLTSQAKTDILYHVSRIEAGGWTNLGSGWMTACREVARQEATATESAPKAVNRVLVLSDGLANVGIIGPDELVEHARELNARGIATSTMGVGVDFNEDLLESMARQGGGRFQYVESARQIPDCVQGELGELLQVTARGVAVEVTFPSGVRFQECLNDYLTDRTRDGVRIRLGDLASGDIRRIVLEVQVDAASDVEGIAPIHALAVFTDGETGRGSELAFPEVRFRLGVDDEQTSDPEVEREVSLLGAAQARREAVRLSVLGDHRAAHDVLADVCGQLLASPYASHPTMVSQIQSLSDFAAHANRGLGRAQRHELTYQAYLTCEARPRYDRPYEKPVNGGL